MAELLTAPSSQCQFENLLKQVPRQGDWRLKLQIDGPENPILDGGKFAFKRSHAATIDHLFNAPSAPAMDPKETFRPGIYEPLDRFLSNIGHKMSGLLNPVKDNVLGGLNGMISTRIMMVLNKKI